MFAYTDTATLVPASPAEAREKILKPAGLKPLELLAIQMVLQSVQQPGAAAEFPGAGPYSPENQVSQYSVQTAGEGWTSIAALAGSILSASGQKNNQALVDRQGNYRDQIFSTPWNLPGVAYESNVTPAQTDWAASIAAPESPFYQATVTPVLGQNLDQLPVPALQKPELLVKPSEQVLLPDVAFKPYSEAAFAEALLGAEPSAPGSRSYAPKPAERRKGHYAGNQRTQTSYAGAACSGCGAYKG